MMYVHKITKQETGKLTMVDSGKRKLPEDKQWEALYHIPFCTIRIVNLHMNYYSKILFIVAETG
jgi:hypothetical protein